MRIWLVLAIGGFALNSFALTVYLIRMRSREQWDLRVVAFFAGFYFFEAACLAVAFNHFEVAALLLALGFATQLLGGRPTSPLEVQPRLKKIKPIAIIVGALVGGLAFWWVSQGHTKYTTVFWLLIGAAAVGSLSLSIYTRHQSRPR